MEQTSQNVTEDNTTKVQSFQPTTHNVKNIADFENNTIRERLSDKLNTLSMYSYTTSSGHYKGIIFNNDNVLVPALPYTLECTHDDTDKISTFFTQDFSKYSFYDSYEGSLLRLFYHDGKWHVTTTKKLNAFKSKWGSRQSFGEIFQKGLETEMECSEKFYKRMQDSNGNNILHKFYNSLNRKYTYLFLVCNTHENRVVCLAPENSTVYHIGTFKNNVLDREDNVGLLKPTQHNITSTEELRDHMNNLPIEFLQGLMVYGPNGEQLKIYHKTYYEYLRLRGNEANVRYRYLQVRMNARMSKTFYYLYSEHAKDFDEYENILYNIARNLYRAYVNRFINRQYVSLPKEQYKVISEAHKWHTTDRKQNRINENKVIEILNSQKASNLNTMIKQYKTEVRQKNEQHEKNQYRTPKTNTNENKPVSPLMLPKTK